MNGEELVASPHPNDAWYLGTTDIWGTDRADLKASMPPPSIPDDGSGSALAYAIALQLHSRVATQKLGFRAGDEATALQSVYELFPFTRERAETAGPGSSKVADLAWWMLNRDVRPFTARWHRAVTKGALSIGDVARRFRAELEHLRSELTRWAELFRRLAGAPIPRFDSPESAAYRRRAVTSTKDMRSAPCDRDGMAAPTAFVDAFRLQVAAELPLLGAWRKRCGRQSDALLSGIALSGGGIRSATFALGVLRQLAMKIPIFAVDYISTVSGGGYLGSLVAAAFESDITAGDLTRGPLGRDEKGDLGAATIAWLRGRAQSMKVDLALLASLGGTLLAEHGLADEYEERLRSTWLLSREDVDGFGPVIGAAPSGKPLYVGEMKAAEPVQLWNMAINVTNLGPRMATALRGRHADMYTVSRAGAECRLLGHSKPTGWTVARAMALSGAAAAPTTAEDAPSWALRIAAALGANLGRWVDHETGRPQAASWWKNVKALFGSVDETNRTAFITDGGHVENTAIYQLLRRRCAVILAIDGEQDGDMTFSGLMKLQHLARVEQGIELDIDLTDLFPDASGNSDSHFTVIPVRYPSLLPDVPAQSGLIVYVKLSLTGDEPQYIRSYKARNPEFPHRSTADQSYDDRTFEAYLALGEHVGECLLDPGWVGKNVSGCSVEEWVLRLGSRFAEQ